MVDRREDCYICTYSYTVAKSGCRICYPKKEEEMAYSRDTEFSFVIEKHIGVLSTNKSNWTKELNVVKWGENRAKLDIRDWSPDHKAMGKGVSLSNEEARELSKILSNGLPENM